MIVSAAEFAEYWQRVHRRTRDMVAALPPDRLDWWPAPGEMSKGRGKTKSLDRINRMDRPNLVNPVHPV